MSKFLDLPEYLKKVDEQHFTAFWAGTLYKYEVGQWVMYKDGNGWEDDGIVEDRKLSSLGYPLYFVNGRYRHIP